MNSTSEQAKSRSKTSSKLKPKPKSAAQAGKVRSSSVERAFQIMEELAANTSVFGLSFSVLKAELGRREDIPHGTLSSLLHALNRLGYLRYNKEKKLYSLGLRLINLGEMAKKRVQGGGLDKECVELLKLVVDQTKRGAHIAVLDSGYAVYLLREDAPGFFGPRIWPGKLQVPHFTAVGKALICRLDQDRLQEILDLHRTSSKIGTSKSIRELEPLKEDLADVHRRGYAIDDGEHALEVRCVAAPIYSGSDRVVASIGVSCRKEEVSLEKLHEYGGVLRVEADKAARTPRILNMLKRYSHQ